MQGKLTEEELLRIEELEADERKEDEHEDVIELALLLGRAILESGGEMQRAEYAVDRLCRAYGAVDTDSYATGTVIILTAEFENGDRTTRSVRIRKDRIDLRKLEEVNALSREFCATAPPVADAARRLKEAMARKTATLWQEVTGVALGSFGMTVASMGTPLDGLVAAIAAAAVMLLGYYLSRVMNKFASTLLSSFLASMVCVFLYALGMGDNLPTMIVGEIMILIPGLTLTNAVRDMLCGDVTSGAVKFLQSLMVTLGLAIGISVALVAAGGLVSGVDINAVPPGGFGGDYYPVVRSAAGVVAYPVRPRERARDDGHHQSHGIRRRSERDILPHDIRRSRRHAHRRTACRKVQSAGNGVLHTRRAPPHPRRRHIPYDEQHGLRQLRRNGVAPARRPQRLPRHRLRDSGGVRGRIRHPQQEL